MHAGKWQIFAKDFTKEWVEYPIALVSIAIAKELIIYNAIAKFSVNGTFGLVLWYFKMNKFVALFQNSWKYYQSECSYRILWLRKPKMNKYLPKCSPELDVLISSKGLLKQSDWNCKANNLNAYHLLWSGVNVLSVMTE